MHKYLGPNLYARSTAYNNTYSLTLRKSMQKMQEPVRFVTNRNGSFLGIENYRFYFWMERSTDPRVLHLYLVAKELACLSYL